MFLSGYALARPLSSLVHKHVIPVDLNYASYIPPNGNKTQNALVLLHGLLYVRSDSSLCRCLILGSGSKRVWTSLSRTFLKELDIPVYALVSSLYFVLFVVELETFRFLQDLRNQGDSPHVKPMTYSHMATDVLHFIHKHSLSNITLLGHSMCVCVLRRSLFI